MFCADAFDVCLHRALLLGNIKKQNPNGFVPPVTWPGMEPWRGRFVFGIFLFVFVFLHLSTLLRMCLGTLKYFE